MKGIKILSITLGLASISSLVACTDIYTTETRVHHYPAPYYPRYPARPIYYDPVRPAPYYPGRRIYHEPRSYPARRIHHGPIHDAGVKHIPEAAPYSAPPRDSRIKHIPQ